MIPPVFVLLSADSTIAGYLGNNPCRVYPFGEAPELVTFPYVTWQTINGVPENNLSETPPIDRIAVQLDVWTRQSPETQAALDCWAIAEAIRDVLEPHAHMTFFGNTERGGIDTRTYRHSLTFDFWQPR
jgi:hypothetical protein